MTKLNFINVKLNQISHLIKIKLINVNLKQNIINYDIKYGTIFR